MSVLPSMLLMLDTAADICSVSIADTDKVIDSIDLEEKNIHSEKLTRCIEQLLARNKISFSQFIAVGINKGPGSYTGLRIGTAVAKGICFALQIPLISCDGLEAYAYNIASMENNFDYILTALDARRDEVYACLIRKDKSVIYATSPLILDDRYNDFLSAHCQGNIGIFSNCPEKFLRLTKVNNVSVYGNEFFKSLYLHHQLAIQLRKKVYENLHYFEPNYIKIGYNTK